jgi:hypothetical protein
VSRLDPPVWPQFSAGLAIVGLALVVVKNVLHQDFVAYFLLAAGLCLAAFSLRPTLESLPLPLFVGRGVRVRIDDDKVLIYPLAEVTDGIRLTYSKPMPPDIDARAYVFRLPPGHGEGNRPDRPALDIPREAYVYVPPNGKKWVAIWFESKENRDGFLNKHRIELLIPAPGCLRRVRLLRPNEVQWRPPSPAPPPPADPPSTTASE